MNSIKCLLLSYMLMALFNFNIKAQVAKNIPTIQSRNFTLEGLISLDSLTNYIHKNSGIRFSFNSIKVKGSTKIYFPKKSYSFQSVLNQVKKSTSLYYSYYLGYVIFQDNLPKPQKKVDENIHKRVGVQKKIITPSNKKDFLIRTINNNSIVKKDSFQQKQINTLSIVNVIKKDSITKVVFASTHLLDTNASVVDSVLGKKSKTLSNSIKPSNDSILIARKPVKKIDTIVNITSTSIAKKTNRSNSLLHFGLQWNLNIPFNGITEYFINSKAKSQPQLLLIPAIWFSKTIGQQSNELLLSLKFEQAYFTGNKVLETSTERFPTIDSIIIQRKTSVLKTNTIYLGLQYNYYINEKWTIGGGVNYHWQSSALANLQTIRSSNNGTSRTDSLYSINKNSQQWKYLTTNFITAKLEVLYTLNKLAIGSALFLPISSMYTAIPNTYGSLNGHFFVRWRIK